VKNDEGQQKIKIIRTNRQSNLWASCQSIFSLSRHHPHPSLLHGPTHVQELLPREAEQRYQFGGAYLPGPVSNPVELKAKK